MCDWCWGSWSCSFLSPSSGPSLTSRYPQPVPYHPTVPLISQQATQNREICRISLFQFSCSTIKHSTLLFISILYAVQYIVCDIPHFFFPHLCPSLPPVSPPRVPAGRCRLSLWTGSWGQWQSNRTRCRPSIPSSSSSSYPSLSLASTLSPPNAVCSNGTLQLSQYNYSNTHCVALL